MLVWRRVPTGSGACLADSVASLFSQSASLPPRESDTVSQLLRQLLYLGRNQGKTAIGFLKRTMIGLNVHWLKKKRIRSEHPNPH